MSTNNISQKLSPIDPNMNARESIDYYYCRTFVGIGQFTNKCQSPNDKKKIDEMAMETTLNGTGFSWVACD